MKGYDYGVQARLMLGRLWQANRQTVRAGAIVAIGVLAIPPVEQYWFHRMPQLPDVPVTVIVFTGMAALFMCAFAAAVYVCGQLLLQISQNEPTVIVNGEPSTRRQRRTPTGPATEGSYIVADDETLWLREQFDELKKKGIVTETDTMDLETMAKELGLQAILKAKGRTE